MTAPALVRMPVTMRRVNDLIWESLGDDDSSDPVAFFCECGRVGCYRPVWLTAAEYAQGRGRADWVAVAETHGEAGAR